MNDLELSPEADQFLAEATAEFNDKQEVLNRDWGFDRIRRWDYDQPIGTFRLTLKDRSLVERMGRSSEAFVRMTARGNGPGTIRMRKSRWRAIADW